MVRTLGTPAARVRRASLLSRGEGVVKQGVWCETCGVALPAGPEFTQEVLRVRHISQYNEDIIIIT